LRRSWGAEEGAEQQVPLAPRRADIDVGHDHTGYPVQVGRVPEARGGAAEQSPFGVSPPSPLSARFPAGDGSPGSGHCAYPVSSSFPIPSAVAGAPLRRGARSVSIAAMLEVNAPPRLPYVEPLDCGGVAGLATRRAPSSHLFHLGCDFVARRAWCWRLASSKQLPCRAWCACRSARQRSASTRAATLCFPAR
jgi:hypothetical protein